MFSTMGEPAAAVSEPLTSEIVACSTLGRYASDNYVSQIDMLKLDAEGAELLVLKGGENLLRGSKAPLIICEFNAPLAKSMGYELSELKECIESLGYTLYRINEDFTMREIGESLEIQNYANLVAMKRRLSGGS